MYIFMGKCPIQGFYDTHGLVTLKAIVLTGWYSGIIHDFVAFEVTYKIKDGPINIEVPVVRIAYHIRGILFR